MVQNLKKQEKISKTDWLDIAVVGEFDSLGGLSPATFQLMAKAINVADSLRLRVNLLLIGHEIMRQGKLFFRTGVDRVFVYDAPCFAAFSSSLFGVALADFAEEYKPSLLLFSDSDMGCALAAESASRLEKFLLPPQADFDMMKNRDLSFPVSVDGWDAVAEDRPQLLILSRNERRYSGLGELLICEIPAEACREA